MQTRKQGLTSLLLIWWLVGCGASTATVVPAPNAVGAAPPSFSCSFNQPSISSMLPADTIISEQSVVNCFAWQNFIALNWDADPNERGQPDQNQPASSFGEPNDLAPTVWQTYKLNTDVFLPKAQTPAAWNANDLIPSPCQPQLAGRNLPDIKVLNMGSKFDDLIPDSLQASGEILVDQQSNMVHYEKRMNRDEFEYITQTLLYNADVQANVAQTQGIMLPVGTSSYGSDGAIEIKAAWRILDNQPSTITNRYKTTLAMLYDADTNTCVGPTTMGLVGLHIIRRTPNMQQLMWSTFEQIDNVPQSSLPDQQAYSFYNPVCALPDPCNPNATPLPTATPPGIPTLEPVQVERVLALPSDVVSLNQAVQALIAQTNSDSVWQYYQLVNVRWPKASLAGQPGAGATAPINISQFQFTSSGPQNVSNTTMETYVQQQDCLNCHVYANIAASAKAGCNPKLASDFSFMFDNADTPDSFASNNCQSAKLTPSEQFSVAQLAQYHQTPRICRNCHR